MDAAPNPAIAEIIARIPLGEAVTDYGEAFRARVPAFARLPEASHGDVLVGVERNLRRWRRWLSTGIAPADGDFDPLRDWARARASEGVRLEDLLRAFGLGGQLGWRLLRRHARPGEEVALLDAAGLLMSYVDRVSAIVAETYLAERDALVSEDERRTRNLLERLAGDAPLDANDRELAARLGVPIEDAYVPFAIVMAGRPPRRHAALAARLRQRGWPLTVTEGDRVVGLTWRPLELADLDEGPGVVLAIARAAPRGELAEAREEVVLLAEHGRRHGLSGCLHTDDHLIELLVGRAPRTAERLRERLLAPLPDELACTLRTLIDCRFDRGATSAALQIHRNTLTYRLGRIQAIVGIDLDDPRDLVQVYLASAESADHER